MHADQHLVAGDLGLADVPELEHIRRAVAVLDDRLHALLLAEGAGPAGIGAALTMHPRSRGEAGLAAARPDRAFGFLPRMFWAIDVFSPSRGMIIHAAT
jgi:hypothetical protein